MAFAKFGVFIMLFIIILSASYEWPFPESLIVAMPGILFGMVSGFYFWEFRDPEDYQKKERKIKKMRKVGLWMAFISSLLAIGCVGLLG